MNLLSALKYLSLKLIIHKNLTSHNKTDFLLVKTLIRILHRRSLPFDGTIRSVLKSGGMANRDEICRTRLKSDSKLGYLNRLKNSSSNGLSIFSSDLQ